MCILYGSVAKYIRISYCIVLSYRPVTITRIQTFLSYVLDRGVTLPLKQQAPWAGWRLLLLTFPNSLVSVACS